MIDTTTNPDSIHDELDRPIRRRINHISVIM